MPFIADLHIHSRFSRATGRDADLSGYYRWAQVKGITLLGTGDFTHPGWLSEISDLLVEEDGLLRFAEPPSGSALSAGRPADIPVRFILTAEISSIYKKKDRTRKVHSLLLVPSLDAARTLGRKLSAIGNIASDGRPILGLDPKDLLSILLDVAPDGIFIPAHIWTPWFSLFGSKSGFDRIEDCFEDLTPHIPALETGLSSDPDMNRRWSALDRFRLVSNSDAHSPRNLGREANILDTEITYEGVRSALVTGRGFLGTYEFYPQEGKYHADGHRKCGVCMDPEETIAHGETCPKCGKPMTVGVLHRVLTLADRPRAVPPRPGEGFRSLIPLAEILSELAGAGPASKGVIALYEKIVGAFGSEFGVLFDAPLEDIRKAFGGLCAEAISRMRAGKIDASPGYDGEFGRIRVFTDDELERLRGQDGLFAIPSISRKKRAPDQWDLLPLGAPAGAAEKSQPTAQALDPEQEKIAQAASGVSLIFAGPGTGKTRVLTHWIARRIRESSGEALAVTFTNRAAREMRERLEALLGGDAGRALVSTFHAFCFSLLRDRDPGLKTVYSAGNREDLLRLILPAGQSGKARTLAERIEKRYEGTAESDPELAGVLDLYEQALRGIGAVDLSALIGRTVTFLSEDRAALDALRSRFRFVAVDELQDIDRSQYELLALLTGPRDHGTAPRRVLCIGDPDQSIYGFRGADRGLFFRFRDEHADRTFALARTYRSTATIVRAAASVMAAASDGSTAGSLDPVLPPGEAVQVLAAADPVEEGAFITQTIADLIGGVDSIGADASRDRAAGFGFADIAVLFRTRAVRDALLPAFSKAGIPTALKESAPLHAERPFNYLIAALRLLDNPRDAASMAKLLEHMDAVFTRESAGQAVLDVEIPPEELPSLLEGKGMISCFSRDRLERLLCRREELASMLSSGGIAAVMDDLLSGTVLFDRDDPETAAGEEQIRESADEHGADLAGFLRGLSLLAVESEGAFRAEKVALLTFHAAKGLEYPVVFVAGAEEGILPLGDDVEEERRLFYVALTRARERLFVSHCARRSIHGRWLDMRPSRFIADIPPDLREGAAVRTRQRRQSGGQLTLFG